MKVSEGKGEGRQKKIYTAKKFLTIYSLEMRESVSGYVLFPNSKLSTSLFYNMLVFRLICFPLVNTGFLSN